MVKNLSQFSLTAKPSRVPSTSANCANFPIFLCLSCVCVCFAFEFCVRFISEGNCMLSFHQLNWRPPPLICHVEFCMRNHLSWQVMLEIILFFSIWGDEKLFGVFPICVVCCSWVLHVGSFLRIHYQYLISFAWRRAQQCAKKIVIVANKVLFVAIGFWDSKPLALLHLHWTPNPCHWDIVAGYSNHSNLFLFCQINAWLTWDTTINDISGVNKFTLRFNRIIISQLSLRCYNLTQDPIFFISL